MPTKSRATPALFTIGYEGLDQATYLGLLREHHVTVLCDVRRNAISHKAGFSKSALARDCESVGIRYEHVRELGIATEQRRGLKTEEDYEKLFAKYARQWLPQQAESLAKIREWLEAGERVALACFEHDASHCHRHFVAEALESELGKRFHAKNL